MNKIMILLLSLIPFIANGQDDYVSKKNSKEINFFKKNNNKIEHKFSFGLTLGIGINNYNSIPTGLLDSLKNDVNININGGVLLGISFAYEINNKIDLEFAYEYTSSGMEKGSYPNGTGHFKRQIISPTLKFSPFILKKHKLQFLTGFNYVFKSSIVTDFELLNGPSLLIYNYSQNLGVIVGTEYEFRSKKMLSPRLGLKYTWNQFHFNNGSYNEKKILSKSIPDNTAKFNSDNLFLYFSYSLNIRLKENIKIDK
jgi:hypothetical protein